MANPKVEVIISAKDNASSTIRGVGNSLDSLNNSVNHATKMLAGMALAAGAAITGAGVYALNVAANYEMQSVSFKTMLGDATKAGALMKELSDFAAKTPFELPNVVEAGKQLLAYGFNAKEIIPNVEMLGNVAAGLNIPLGDMTYLFGTLKAQGRAYTRDIMQFAMRGILIYEELAKVMGVSKDKIKDLVEEGKVGFPEVEKAFQNMTGEGGRFHDLMKEQAKTFTGVVSNIKDNIGRLALSMMGVTLEGQIREGSLFYYIRMGATKLLEWIDKNQAQITGFFDNMSKKIVEIGTSIYNWWSQNKDEIISFLTVLGTTVLSIAGFLTQHRGIIDGLAAAYLAFKTTIMINNIIGTFNNIANVIFGTTGAISGAGGLIPALTQLAVAPAFGYSLIFLVSMAAAIELYTWIERINNKLYDLETRTIQSGWDIDDLSAKFRNGSITAQQYKDGLERIKNESANSSREASNLAREMQGIIDKSSSITRIMGGFAIGGFFGGLYRAITGRASGGSVTPGQPYVVGEKGPELFLPRQAGIIIPHNKVGSGMMNFVININGNINNKEGFTVNEISKMIGRQIELAVGGAR